MPAASSRSPHLTKATKAFVDAITAENNPPLYTLSLIHIYHTDEQAAQRADDAERDHGDDDHGVLHQHERVPDEVAEAVFAREHFTRDQREPRVPHADLKSGEDERHGARQDDLEEYVAGPCAE